jgi:hypothetical protein
MKKVLTVALAGVFLMASAGAQSDPIVTQSTSTSTTTTNGDTTTKVISPPPSAISPAVTVINSDVCVVGYSGAAQTQVLGISFGGTSKDYNCERIKLARSLYDMGMKVAAVAELCQDERVFTAMMNAGTPCPIDGQIGASAKELWEANPDRKPQKIKSDKN